MHAGGNHETAGRDGIETTEVSNTVNTINTRYKEEITNRRGR